MTYYKMIRDNIIIGAGFIFLKWNEKHRCLFACSVDDAQLIQTHDQTAVYHADWLKPVPTAAGEYETVQAAVIDAVEFDEIIALLTDGETIENNTDEAENIVEQPDSEIQNDETEKPMTVAEMRQSIADQQDQINMLTECILEMSGIVYG